MPPPTKAEISQPRRDEIATICRRADLDPPKPVFEQFSATAGYVEEMVAHLHTD